MTGAAASGIDSGVDRAQSVLLGWKREFRQMVLATRPALLLRDLPLAPPDPAGLPEGPPCLHSPQLCSHSLWPASSPLLWPADPGGRLEGGAAARRLPGEASLYVFLMGRWHTHDRRPRVGWSLAHTQEPAGGPLHLGNVTGGVDPGTPVRLGCRAPWPDGERSSCVPCWARNGVCRDHPRVSFFGGATPPNNRLGCFCL